MLDERKALIINYLLEQDNFITIKEMSVQFSVSLRTIRYDLDSLDNWLVDNGFKPLSRLPRKGVLLESNLKERELIKSKLNSNDFYSYVLSPEERKELVLLNILKEGKAVNLIDLAAKTCVSKTTIANDLDDISRWLKEYQIKLIRKKGYGIYVEGNEENKRNAISSLLKELANPHKQTNDNESVEKYIDSLKEWFPNIDLYFIRDEIQKAQQKLMIKFSYEGFVSLLSHLALAIERVSLGKDILMSKEQLQELMSKEEFNIAKSISKNISQFFNLRIPLDETGYITLHLIGSKLSYVGDQDNYFKKNSELLLIIDKMIQSIEKDLNIVFTNQASLKKDLYIHLMPTIHRLKYNKPLQNPLLKEIISKYKYIFDACNEAKIYLEQQFKIKVNDHETAYIAMHFGAAIEAQRPKINRNTNILLVCASGIGTSRLLKANLLSYFRAFNIIDTVSYQDVNNYMDSDKIDLIISTIPIKKTKLPVIVVSPLLNKRDIKILSSYLMLNENFKYNKAGMIMNVMDIISKHCTIENFDALQTDITSLFNNINRLYTSKSSWTPQNILCKEDIQVLVECNTWEDAIHKAAKPLLEKGYIDTKYIDSIFEKIKLHGPYMVIAPGIAMPHAGIGDGSVNKTSLSIMTLKNPVKFNHEKNDPVHTVIFLAATDNHTHIETLVHLLEILSVKENIEKLTTSSTQNEIYELLKQEE